MKIICATDFSARALAAARVGVEFARRTAGSVELLHVVPPRVAEMMSLGTDTGVFDDRLRGDGEVRLAAECRDLASGGVAVTSWLSEGDIESSILSRAAAIDADLIVMGAHSRPAFERFVLGSTAERTVRRTDRPVLVVPPGTSLPEGMANGQGQFRVVVAVDGRAASRGALDFVRALRKQIACDVTFLRLYWPTEEYERLGLTGARDLSKPDPEVVADLTRSLALEVGVLPGSGQTTVAIEGTWGDPAARILELAATTESDLIVMGAESRRGLARIAHSPVASRVARLVSGVPVVFVPPPAVDRGPEQVPRILTVLAPTDLSAAGNRAIPFAYSMLASHGGVVELCYVHERTLPSPSYLYDRPEGKLSDADRERIVAELRAVVPSEAERLGIVTHVNVVDGGKAGPAILQAAERLAVDSIVLGSHGRGGVYRALLGSVSEEVVRGSHRPVLVVPGSKEAS